MGPIKFYPEGIQVKGSTYVRSNLYARSISGRKDSGLQIYGKNLTLQSVSRSTEVPNRLNINPDSIQIIANELRILSSNQNSQFIMSDDKFSYSLKQLEISSK